MGRRSSLVYVAFSLVQVSETTFCTNAEGNSPAKLPHPHDRAKGRDNLRELHEFSIQLAGS